MPRCNRLMVHSTSSKKVINHDTDTGTGRSGHEAVTTCLNRCRHDDDSSSEEYNSIWFHSFLRRYHHPLHLTSEVPQAFLPLAAQTVG